MELFWRQGYKATTVRDLAGAMGINHFSLYDTFGDKQALYVKAIERYRERVTGELIELLGRGEGLRAIAAYFARLAELLSSPAGRRGCLVQNATVERAALDPAVAVRTRAANRAVEDALHGALERARRAGVLAGSDSLRDRAHALFAIAQGMIVMAKNDDASSADSAARFVTRELEAWRANGDAP
jgi:TetR/AcrR family transcriptional repressor of nem operon